MEVILSLFFSASFLPMICYLESHRPCIGSVSSATALLDCVENTTATAPSSATSSSATGKSIVFNVCFSPPFIPASTSSHKRLFSNVNFSHIFLHAFSHFSSLDQVSGLDAAISIPKILPQLI